MLKFTIQCKACGGGWVMMDVGYEDASDAVTLFPRLLCLRCGAREDVRGHMTRTEPMLIATVEPSG